MAQNDVGSLIINLEARTAALERDISASTRELKGLRESANRTAGALGEMQQDSQRAAAALDSLAADGGAASSVLEGLQTAAGALSFGVLVGGLVQAEKQFGAMDVQLTVAMKSADLAAVQFAKLEELAFRLSVPVDLLTNAYVKLKNMGLDPSERALVSYANTAAASNKTISDMIEAVADAATGEFERLKEFGIKSSAQGDQVKFTFQGVETTVRNSSEAINQYLTSIGENQYAGAQEMQAKTLGGAITLLEQRIAQYQRTINQGGVGQAMADGTAMLAENLDVLAGAVGVVSAVMAGRLVGSLSAAAVATIASVAETRSATAAAAAQAQSELVLAARHKELAMLDLSRARMMGVSTAATEAAAIATANYNRALAASEVANAAAARGAGILGGAVGLLGGPIGIVTTALSLGAMAWAAWGNTASDALSLARQELARLNKEKKFGTGNVGTFNAAVADNETELARLRERRKLMYSRGMHTGGIDDEIAKLTKETESFKAAASEASKAQAGMNATVATGAQQSVEFLTRQQQKEKEIEEVRSQFNLATVGRQLTQAQLHQLTIARTEKLSDIEEKYSDKSKRRVSAGARVAEQVADAYGDVERSLQKQLLTEEELTEVQKLNLQFSDKRYQHLSAAQKANLLGLAEEVDAFKQQQKLYKEMAGAAKELAEADTRRQQEAVEAAYQSYQRVADQVKALQQEADTYGLSAGGMQDYLLAKAEERLALEKSGEARVGVIEQLEREIAERQKLAGLQRSKDVREAGEEAAKRTADEWQRASDQISDALTDALMKGFDDGKSFAENFADTLENTFKTMVLRPMVQAIVQPVGNAIGQAMNGQPGANGQSLWSGQGFGGNVAGGFGSMLGQVGNWTGSASMAAYGTGMGLSASEAAAAAEAYRAAGMGDIASQLQAGQSASSTVGTVATAAGYVMAAYNGIKAIEDGRWGSAAGTAIGAWFGGPLGASIGGQIGGMVDDMFGGGGGPKTGGEGWTGTQRDEFYTPGESDRQLRDTVRQLQAQYIGMAVSLGGSAKGLQFGLGFDSDPNGSAGDRVKSALYGANGQAVYSVLDRGVESAQDGVKAEANRLLVAALQQSDLPANLAKVLSGIDVATASEESLQSALDRVQAIGRIEASFKQLALVFPQLNGLSLEAKERLAELSGGVDNLTGNLGAFYANFVPEEEKRAQVLADIEKELGKVNIRLPTSRQQFREVAEQLQASGQTGSEAFAKMMSVAGAFASVTDAAVESAANRRQSALSDLQAAYDRESDALRSSIERLDQFVRGLRDFRQQLQLGDLSILSPEQKYLEAQRDWQATLAAAQGGDEDARDKLTSVAQAYLEASRAYNASSEQYSRDYATVQAALVTLESSGRAAATLARQQLEVLQKQVDGLLEINKSVLSVRDALKALEGLAKPPASPTAGAGAGVGAGTSGGLPVYSGAGAAPSGTVSPQQAVNDLYKQILGREADVGGLNTYSVLVMQGKSLTEVAAILRSSDEYKSKLPAFARGGLAHGWAIVGEEGPELVNFDSPGRVYTARQTADALSRPFLPPAPAGDARLLAEVSALRAEVASLRRENREDATAQRQQQAVIAGEVLKQGSQLAGQLKTAAASAF